MNIVRDVVAPGETFRSASPFPILVIVGSGELVDVSGTALPVATATVLGTSVELRNDGTEPATVVAGVVGDPAV